MLGVTDACNWLFVCCCCLTGWIAGSQLLLCTSQRHALPAHNAWLAPHGIHCHLLWDRQAMRDPASQLAGLRSH
jgi:hypothetical protein